MVLRSSFGIMQNNQIHHSWQTVCWRCKCVEWEKDDSSDHFSVFHCSWFQALTPHIHGWISDGAYRAQIRGPRGVKGNPISKNLRVKWLLLIFLIAQWNAKKSFWPKHSLWSCHKEGRSHHDTFKGSVYPLRFSLGCLGLVLCTDIMQYWSSKAVGRNQGAVHIKICMFLQGEDSKSQW